MPPQVFLQFGVEIELLLKPRNTPAVLKELTKRGWDKTVTLARGPADAKVINNRRALRLMLADAMTDNSVPTGLVPEGYKKWAIVDETTLDEVTGYWRVEIVSRVLSTGKPWQKEIDDVFRTLHENYEVLISQGCSMHIHVSPGQQVGLRYSLSQLKSMMNAIAFFDEATTAIMPAERKDNPWAWPNMKAPKTPTALKDAYRKVLNDTWAPVFDIFSGVPFPQLAFRQLGQDRVN
ncbi:hypothetical protein VF21_04625 [Pseudogymnoascus sp. 05NY08]|nr:hypothetical protein VF21_04625 [Pseudogymnoascus sp. 05NY08]